MAEEKYNFDIEDNKAIIEAISLDNNIFILTITKLTTDYCTYNQKLKIFYFKDINDLLNLYSFIKKNNICLTKLEIHKFLNKYYIVLNEENSNFENILLEFSYACNNFSCMNDIFIEYGEKA